MLTYLHPYTQTHTQFKTMQWVFPVGHFILICEKHMLLWRRWRADTRSGKKKSSLARNSQNLIDSTVSASRPDGQSNSFLESQSQSGTSIGCVLGEKMRACAQVLVSRKYTYAHAYFYIFMLCLSKTFRHASFLPRHK
jgi:hypothetical protein